MSVLSYHFDMTEVVVFISLLLFLFFCCLSCQQPAKMCTDTSLINISFSAFCWPVCTRNDLVRAFLSCCWHHQFNTISKWRRQRSWKRKKEKKNERGSLLIRQQRVNSKQKAAWHHKRFIFCARSPRYRETRLEVN